MHRKRKKAARKEVRISNVSVCFYVCVCVCSHGHMNVQQLQQVPVQHVYTNQVQYVEAGDTSYTTSTM